MRPGAQRCLRFAEAARSCTSEQAQRCDADQAHISRDPAGPLTKREYLLKTWSQSLERAREQWGIYRKLGVPLCISPGLPKHATIWEESRFPFATLTHKANPFTFREENILFGNYRLVLIANFKNRKRVVRLYVLFHNPSVGISRIRFKELGLFPLSL